MADAEKSLQRLMDAVRGDAAIRRRRRLQPAGGPGDKLFPPTYPGATDRDPPRHVFEHRRIDGQNVRCVLIDSVQSQANRLEEALSGARSRNEVKFPAIAVDFSGTAVADVGRITTLDAPHRVFDAIIRDSALKGVAFKDTAEGKSLILAKTTNARAVFELAPTALLFGAWNSTGQGGGLGAKFPRALVSELIGVGVAEETVDFEHGETRPSGVRTGSRVDPLGIRSAVRVWKGPDGDWQMTPPADAEKGAKASKGGKEEKGKKWKEVRPSEVNHSNIAPTVSQLGVSVDYALHTVVLSMAALRRLQFGGTPEADVAARSALASLGLAATLLQDRAGYALRSRCDLVVEENQSSHFEIVRPDGSIEEWNLGLADALRVVAAAADAAAHAGVTWRREDLVLAPQPKLVTLVEESRQRALSGEGGDEKEV